MNTLLHMIFAVLDTNLINPYYRKNATIIHRYNVKSKSGYYQSSRNHMNTLLHMIFVVLVRNIVNPYYYRNNATIQRYKVKFKSGYICVHTATPCAGCLGILERMLTEVTSE